MTVAQPKVNKDPTEPHSMYDIVNASEHWLLKALLYASSCRWKARESFLLRELRVVTDKQGKVQTSAKRSL